MSLKTPKPLVVCTPEIKAFDITEVQGLGFRLQGSGLRLSPPKPLVLCAPEIKAFNITEVVPAILGLNGRTN